MKTGKTSERGQAIIVIALAMVGLLAIVGLAIDGSVKFSDQRNAQNAADTAAIAAALAKVDAVTAGESNSPPECPPSSGTPSVVCAVTLTAGLDRAASNGYDNNLTTNTVEVHSPPISGYYSGNDEYVQVIITSTLNTTFSRVIGVNQMQNVVQAVALTDSGGPSFDGATVVSLNPSPKCGNGSVLVGGSGTVTLNGGGLFVNSSASCGFKEPNCTNFVINGGGISSAGSPIEVNKCHGSAIPTDATQAQFSIPDDIFIPARPSVCDTKTPVGSFLKTGTDTYTIYPGYYNVFPPISNKKYDLTMSPGIYCIDGNVKWTGGTFKSLTGSGVTLYITSGHSFDMSGGVLNLSATTSGTYAGYLIVLDGTPSSIEDCTINGGGGGMISGSVLAPYCNITVNGNSGTDAYSSQVIGYDVKLNGNNTLNLTYDPSKVAQDPKRVGLIR